MAPASFAMLSKKVKEESSQKLNERKHILIGYCEEDWNQRSMYEFQIAPDEIQKFQVIFDSNSIVMRWGQRLS